jgi:hypothetical protein
MMSVSTMIQVPLLIPLIFGLFIKKTPQWAPWVTVALGLCISWFMLYVFTPEVLAGWLGLDTLTRRESIDMNLMMTIAAHLLITAAFFCSTTFFYKEENDEHKEERELFFEDIVTPIIADDEQDDYDRQQRNKLGSMVIFMGAGVSLMMLIPNPMWGKLVFLLCSLSILTVGILLKKGAKAKP